MPNRRTYLARRQAGLCVECARPAESGYVRCSDHLRIEIERRELRLLVKAALSCEIALNEDICVK